LSRGEFQHSPYEAVALEEGEKAQGFYLYDALDWWCWMWGMGGMGVGHFLGDHKALLGA